MGGRQLEQVVDEDRLRRSSRRHIGFQYKEATGLPLSLKATFFISGTADKEPV